MEVGLVKSLQPPDVLWIHWRVYNSIANISKGVLFLPLSDVYVRSFLCLLYTLVKLYYTKALSDQASSLARIEFFSSGGQESWHLLWFSNNLSILYIENSKDVTRKLVYFTNESVKSQDTKLKQTKKISCIPIH